MAATTMTHLRFTMGSACRTHFPWRKSLLREAKRPILVCLSFPCCFSTTATTTRTILPVLRGKYSKTEDDWQSNFERLAEYAQEQNSKISSSSTTTSTPFSSSPYPRDDPILRAWLGSQRHVLKKKQQRRTTIQEDGTNTTPSSSSRKTRRLTSTVVQDRIAKLASIGYSLAPRAENWESRLQQLQQFVSEHRCFPFDVDSDQLSGDERRLLWWCRSQRKHYNRQQQQQQQQQQQLPANNTSYLTPERINKLESIGFCFDAHETIWKQRYHELANYYRHHGNCRVPSNYPAHPSLAVWVGEQRYHYKKWKEGRRPNSMNIARIQQLNSIGFEWNVFDARWMDKYKLLQEHMRLNGVGRLPQPKHNKELRNWINQQLKLYRAKQQQDGETNSLSEERERLLKELGFPWQYK